MVRESIIDPLNDEINIALVQLFMKCNLMSKHPNDLVVCAQNGSFTYDGCPMIGLGEDGFCSFQSLNSISMNGIKYLTKDDDYFKKQRFVYEYSELEASIRFEMNQYLCIWENVLYLRALTQIVNIAGGNHYDWNLTLRNLPPNKKSEHIRKNIKNKLTTISPLFSILFNKAYIRQIRNAVAHEQFQIVQGGILFNNYKSDQYSDLEGVSFEEWEKIYVLSFLIISLIFNDLKIIQNKRTQFSSLPDHAVEIITPGRNGNWYRSYIAPTGLKRDTWHFVYPFEKK